MSRKFDNTLVECLNPTYAAAQEAIKLLDDKPAPKKKAKKKTKKQKADEDALQKKADNIVEELNKELEGAVAWYETLDKNAEEGPDAGERETQGGAKYKAVFEGGDNEAGNLSDISAALGKEQFLWERARLLTKGKMSFAHCEAVAQIMKDTTSIELLFETSQKYNLDPVKFAGSVDVYCEAQADLRGKNCAFEGDDQATANCEPVPISAFDLSQAPSRNPKCIGSSGIGSLKLALLLRRLIQQKLATWLSHSDLFVLLCSNIFVAPRKGTLLGRIIVDLRSVNTMVKAMSVPPSLTNNIHEILIRPGTIAYSEVDVAAAFPSILLSREVAKYIGLQCVFGVLIGERGILGLKCMPAIWQQFFYSAVIPLSSGEEAKLKFLEELMVAGRLDVEGESEEVYGERELVKRMKEFIKNL